MISGCISNKSLRLAFVRSDGMDSIYFVDVCRYIAGRTLDVFNPNFGNNIPRVKIFFPNEVLIFYNYYELLSSS